MDSDSDLFDDDLLLQEEEEKWEDLTTNENGLDEAIDEMVFDDPAEFAYEEDVDSNEEDLSEKEEEEEEEEEDDDEEEEEGKKLLEIALPLLDSERPITFTIDSALVGITITCSAASMYSTILAVLEEQLSIPRTYIVLQGSRTVYPTDGESRLSDLGITNDSFLILQLNLKVVVDDKHKTILSSQCVSGRSLYFQISELVKGKLFTVLLVYPHSTQVLQCYDNQSLAEIFYKGKDGEEKEQLVEIQVTSEPVITIHYHRCEYYTTPSEWNSRYFTCSGEKVLLYQAVHSCLQAKSSLCVIWNTRLFTFNKEIEIAQVKDHPSIHVYDFGLLLPKGVSIAKFKPKEHPDEYGYNSTSMYKLKYAEENITWENLERLTRNAIVKRKENLTDDYDVFVKTDHQPVLYLPPALFSIYEKNMAKSSETVAGKNTFPQRQIAGQPRHSQTTSGVATHMQNKPKAPVRIIQQSNDNNNNNGNNYNRPTNLNYNRANPAPSGGRRSIQTRNSNPQQQQRTTGYYAQGRGNSGNRADGGERSFAPQGRRKIVLN